MHVKIYIFNKLQVKYEFKKIIENTSTILTEFLDPTMKIEDSSPVTPSA